MRHTLNHDGTLSRVPHYTRSPFLGRVLADHFKRVRPPHVLITTCFKPSGIMYKFIAELLEVMMSAYSMHLHGVQWQHEGGVALILPQGRLRDADSPPVIRVSSPPTPLFHTGFPQCHILQAPGFPAEKDRAVCEEPRLLRRGGHQRGQEDDQRHAGDPPARGPHRPVQAIKSEAVDGDLGMWCGALTGMKQACFAWTQDMHRAWLRPWMPCTHIPDTAWLHADTV